MVHPFESVSDLVEVLAMILVPGLRGHWRGLLAVLGAFLCQLCAGAYHGTFGNLLPYLTSYIRQV